MEVSLDKHSLVGEECEIRLEMWVGPDPGGLSSQHTGFGLLAVLSGCL